MKTAPFTVYLADVPLGSTSKRVLARVELTYDLDRDLFKVMLRAGGFCLPLTSQPLTDYLNSHREQWAGRRETVSSADPAAVLILREVERNRGELETLIKAAGTAERLSYLIIEAVERCFYLPVAEEGADYDPEVTPYTWL